MVDRKTQQDWTSKYFDGERKLGDALGQRDVLGGGKGGFASKAAEFWHKDKTGGCLESAELIGTEVIQAGRVHLKAMVQFLDAIIHFCAGAVNGIKGLALVRKIGDQQWSIELEMAPWQCGE